MPEKRRPDITMAINRSNCGLELTGGLQWAAKRNKICCVHRPPSGLVMTDRAWRASHERMELAVRRDCCLLGGESASLFPAHSSGPVQLSCNGQMTAVRRQVTEDYTIAITVDLGAGTVKVGSYGTAPILGNADGDTLVFMKRRIPWTRSQPVP